MKQAEPLFKYIGGKRWLKSYLRDSIRNILDKNKKITDYVEPFSGGLGAFFSISDILHEYNVKNITLNDINSQLISFYQLVYNDPNTLITQYNDIESEFLNTFPSKSSLLNVENNEDKKILLKNTNEYYKNIRHKFNLLKNKNCLETSAYLLFLQNHCFNGIYRENQKGEHNTPFNWEAKYISPDIISEKIMKAHNVFKQFNIKFSNTSFENIKYNKKTLYYVDPPYINENIIENKYHKEGFNLEKQELLIKCLKNTNFIYSNHKSNLLSQLFSKIILNNIELQEIARKNIISSSKESRKEDKIEVLISHLL